MKLIEAATVTVRIDCRKCAAKTDGCHKYCPQLKAVETEDGKSVTRELLSKGKRARLHRDVDVTFGKFKRLMEEKAV